MKNISILVLALLIVPCFFSAPVLAASQEEIDSAIAEKLVKYEAVKEAIVKDNAILVIVADSSQTGMESALRAIAACLIYGYMSTDTNTATFYVIYLEEKMIDGSFYKVGKSEVYGAEIENAVEANGSIAAKLELGDKMIERLSES